MKRAQQDNPQSETPDAAQLRIARDPTASPEELRRLFAERHSASQRLKDALASNPSTPLDLLIPLVEEAPDAFCRNPIAPMVSLEMPDFLEKVSKAGMARLLSSDKAPAPLIQQIADSRQFYLSDTARLHIKYRPPIPDSVWANEVRAFYAKQISHSEGGKFAAEVIELAELGVISQAIVARYSAHSLPRLEDYKTFHKRLERHNPTAAQKLEKGYHSPPKNGKPSIQDDDRIYEYVGAAFNPQLTPATLLSWCGYALFDEAVARNPTASGTVLLQLAQSPHVHIRRMALRNPACPPEAKEVCRQAILAQILNKSMWEFLKQTSPSWVSAMPWRFGRSIAMIYASEQVRAPFLNWFANSLFWEDRLAVAIALPWHPGNRLAKPRYHSLLKQLARDGICLVRAAAQGRLRGETVSLEE